LRSSRRSILPVLQTGRRIITRHLLGRTDRKSADTDIWAVTLTRRFGSALGAVLYRARPGQGRSPVFGKR
jgi:hypothetical protein